MVKPFHVVIVGGGPAGLSAAIALTKQPADPSSPLRITVLELRKGVQTLGGAVNLTPLALRYLDWLGAGSKLRPQAATVSAIELIAHRTGGLLGRLWPDVDAIRAQRQLLVESLRDTILDLPRGDGLPEVEVVYGAKITDMKEFGDVQGQGGISVKYIIKKDDNDRSLVGKEEHTIDADIVVGCDGIHSQVRASIVDPTRTKTYSGKCNTYGYVKLNNDDNDDGDDDNHHKAAATWKRPDGQPLITDTTLMSKGNNALLMTYYEPSHENLYLAFVNPMAEKKDAREGWSLHGADKEGIKRDIEKTFEGGGLPFVSEDILKRCEEWFFFPVYMLPQGGDWFKGRAILLGDAAHAMPPQGEGTGIAIEDGVLLSRILTRRSTRSVPQLFADYETLRRPDIQQAYKDTMARWNAPVPNGWFSNVAMEWVTWIFVKIMSYRHDYFGRDVRNRELPE